MNKISSHTRRPVDESSKIFLGQPEVASDLLNLCLGKYSKGQNRILPQHLIKLDPAHYNVILKENGVYKSDNRHRDLLFKCQLPNCPGKFIYIGVELQTRYDARMLERCGNYDLQFYIEQKNDIASKEDKELIPIINIVLNLSCTPWSGGNKLIKNPERWPKELMALCPNYFINIFDITKLAKKTSRVVCDEFRTVLNCYRYRNNGRKLRDIMLKGISNGVLGVNAARLINLCLNLKLKLTKRKEKIDMCKGWDDYTRICEKRGEKRGIKMGVKMGVKIGKESAKEKIRTDVVLAMLAEKLPIASIKRVSGKTLAAIRQIAEENGLTICQ